MTGAGGGYTEFLQQLTDAVKEEVKKYLTAEIGAAAGASGGPVGMLIGLAVGYAVDKICDWLILQYFDDIFKPVTVQFTLDSPLVAGGDDFFGGTAWWHYHGGEYGMAFFWRVFRSK